MLSGLLLEVVFAWFPWQLTESVSEEQPKPLQHQLVLSKGPAGHVHNDDTELDAAMATELQRYGTAQVRGNQDKKAA